MGGYMLWLLAICQILRKRWYWLSWKCQNATDPKVFIRSQSIFIRTLLTMVEYSLLLFLTIGWVLFFVGLCNFNTGGNGQTLKCAISWTRLIIERIGWNCGIHGPRNCIHVCRILCLWFSEFILVSFPMLIPQVSSTINEGVHESILAVAHPGYQVLSDILFGLGLIANALTQCSF